jgi:malonyl-CoA decarboxylase
MSARDWFERLLNNVADRGFDLIGLKDRNGQPPSDPELCHRLVDGVGEASNIALAREILQRWQTMDDDRRLAFLTLLAIEMDPDPEAIVHAASTYKARDPDSLKQLLEVTEPPRLELFRRLNMAPGGTAVLVSMRAYLLSILNKHPELKNVDTDFQHLLSSWFNRGFLQLELINWNTPASILEKLIRYEAVHPMTGWEDLRRRLGRDRRCFAFFHPALPQDPLIFVEVALTRTISDSIIPLINPDTEEANPENADTAVFYSINNALKGLRGVSFGNFLIKQVVTELSAEFAGIHRFVTLSPLPSLRQGISSLLANELGESLRLQLNAVVGDRLQTLRQASEQSNLTEILDELTASNQPTGIQELVNEVLIDIILFYLVYAKRGEHAYESVAHFHLSNGARLERINTQANPSERGLLQAWGCMVNYRYEANDLVQNHESYATHGSIALSRDLEKRLKKLAVIIESA